MNVLSILERNFRRVAIPAGPQKEKTRAIWPGPSHPVNYQVTLAPPATIAPSRPATITISFFIATTPTSDSAKAAQRTSLGVLHATLPCSGRKSVAWAFGRPAGSERTFVGTFGQRSS